MTVLAADRPTVAILDPIHPVGIDRLSSRFNIIAPEDVGSTEPVFTVYAVVRTSPVTEAWFAERPMLKAIVKHGAGVDNIDIRAASRRGIIVANTPGGNNALAVAEGAVTLMLSVLRRVRDMDQLVREHRFNERWRVELGDLTGGRLGLLGFGKIARNVARICGSGFGMEVSAYDPFVSADAMMTLGVRKQENIASLMGNDVISLHLPLTPESHNIIGAAEVAEMSPSAIIVNTSRGGLIDENALAAALKAGRIRGAGIDVFESEPPLRDNPLLNLPNVVLSPHMAGVTEASMKGMALAVADVVETVEAGRRPITILNSEALKELP